MIVAVAGIETDDDNTITGVKLKDGTVIDCDAICCTMGPWSPKTEDFFDTINVPVQGIKSTSIVWEAREDTDGVALFCGEDDRFNTHLEVYPRPSGEIYCCGVGGSDYIQPDEVSSSKLRSDDCCS